MLGTATESRRTNEISQNTLRGCDESNMDRAWKQGCIFTSANISVLYCGRGTMGDYPSDASSLKSLWRPILVRNV
jgi:hypothetical protein